MRVPATLREMQVFPGTLLRSSAYRFAMVVGANLVSMRAVRLVFAAKRNIMQQLHSCCCLTDPSRSQQFILLIACSAFSKLVADRFPVTGEWR